MILGLDVSSSVVGYCILDLEGTIIKLDYHKFDKENTLLEKAFEIDTLLNKLTTEYKITTLGIEENLKSFRAGGTNADAMLKTSKMNFLTLFLVKKMGIPIIELNVNNARAIFYPSFHKLARQIKEQKQKEVLFDIVVKQLPENTFPTKTMKSGVNKGNVVFLDEARDMADAYVIAKVSLIKVKV